MRICTENSAKKGFTLVELIVVIVIVGILSTIGFVSYSGYLIGARDSNRLGQLANLTEALQVFSTSKRLPLPDGSVKITIGDPDDIVAFQGDAGINVIDSLDYNNGGKDPKDKAPFSYMVTKDRKSFQLLAFMEETSSLTNAIIPEAYAVNYEERYVKTFGNRLGILTSAETDDNVYNTPAHLMAGITDERIDIVDSDDDYTAHISDSEKIEGSGPVLRTASPIHSCKRIKQSGIGTNSTTYTINPAGAGDILVYCDMETLGGGWTLIARSTSEGSGGFTWGTGIGTVQNMNAPYVMGDVTNLTYDEVMMASYAVKRRVTDTNITINDSVDDFSEGPYTLTVDEITGSGPLENEQGMFFVR